MKALKTYLSYALLLLMVAACSPLQRVAIPTDPVEATQMAQNYINEANVTLISIANVVAENRKNDIITVAERDAYVAKLKEFAKRVDEAQVLLRTGDLDKAFNQAELLKTLIIALHREVAAKARQS